MEGDSDGKMGINFRTINVEKDKETILCFSKLTLLANGMGSKIRSFDSERYLNDLTMKIPNNPDGYVLMEIGNEIVGQIELQQKEYEDQAIGYVSKYYLVNKYRGKGFSKVLIHYSDNLFKNMNLQEYHLRVTKNNKRAIKFYDKYGFTVLKEEENSFGVPCYRMRKTL